MDSNSPVDHIEGVEISPKSSNSSITPKDMSTASNDEPLLVEIKVEDPTLTEVEYSNISEKDNVIQDNSIEIEAEETGRDSIDDSSNLPQSPQRKNPLPPDPESPKDILVLKAVVPVTPSEKRKLSSVDSKVKVKKIKNVVKKVETLPEGFLKCTDCGFLTSQYQSCKNCRKCGAKLASEPQNEASTVKNTSTVDLQLSPQEKMVSSSLLVKDHKIVNPKSSSDASASERSISEETNNSLSESNLEKEDDQQVETACEKASKMEETSQNFEMSNIVDKTIKFILDKNDSNNMEKSVNMDSHFNLFLSSNQSTEKCQPPEATEKNLDIDNEKKKQNSDKPIDTDKPSLVKSDDLNCNKEIDRQKTSDTITEVDANNKTSNEIKEDDKTTEGNIKNADLSSNSEFINSFIQFIDNKNPSQTPPKNAASSVKCKKLSKHVSTSQTDSSGTLNTKTPSKSVKTSQTEKDISETKINSKVVQISKKGELGISKSKTPCKSVNTSKKEEGISNTKNLSKDVQTSKKDEVGISKSKILVTKLIRLPEDVILNHINKKTIPERDSSETKMTPKPNTMKHSNKMEKEKNLRHKKINNTKKVLKMKVYPKIKKQIFDKKAKPLFTDAQLQSGRIKKAKDYRALHGMTPKKKKILETSLGLDKNSIHGKEKKIGTNAKDQEVDKRKNRAPDREQSVEKKKQNKNKTSDASLKPQKIKVSLISDKKKIKPPKSDIKDQQLLQKVTPIKTKENIGDSKVQTTESSTNSVSKKSRKGSLNKDLPKDCKVEPNKFKDLKVELTDLEATVKEIQDNKMKDIKLKSREDSAAKSTITKIHVKQEKGRKILKVSEETRINQNKNIKREEESDKSSIEGILKKSAFKPTKRSRQANQKRSKNKSVSFSETFKTSFYDTEYSDYEDGSFEATDNMEGDGISDDETSNTDDNSPQILIKVENDSKREKNQCYYCDFIANSKKGLVKHILAVCKNFSPSDLITCQKCDNANDKTKGSCINCSSKCNIEGCTFSTWFKKVMVEHKTIGKHMFQCKLCRLKTENSTELMAHLCNSENEDKPRLDSQHKKRKSDKFQSKRLDIIKSEESDAEQELKKNSGKKSFSQKLTPFKLENNFAKIEETSNDAGILEDNVNNIMYVVDKSEDSKISDENSDSSDNDTDDINTEHAQDTGVSEDDLDPLKKIETTNPRQCVACGYISKARKTKILQVCRMCHFHHKDRAKYVDELKKSDINLRQCVNCGYIAKDPKTTILQVCPKCRFYHIDRNILAKNLQKGSLLKDSDVLGITVDPLLDKPSVKTTTESDNISETEASKTSDKKRNQNLRQCIKCGYIATFAKTKILQWCPKCRYHHTDRMKYVNDLQKPVNANLRECVKCGYVAVGKLTKILEFCPKCRFFHRERRELSRSYYKKTSLHNRCFRCGFISHETEILKICPNCNYEHTNRFHLKEEDKDPEDDSNINDVVKDLMSEERKKLKSCVNCQYVSKQKLLLVCPKCHFKHTDRFKKRLAEDGSIDDVVKDLMSGERKKLKTCVNCRYVSKQKLLLICPKCQFKHVDRFKNKLALKKVARAPICLNKACGGPEDDLTKCCNCGNIAKNKKSIMQVCAMCQCRHVSRFLKVPQKLPKAKVDKVSNKKTKKRIIVEEVYDQSDSKRGKSDSKLYEYLHKKSLGGQNLNSVKNEPCIIKSDLSDEDLDAEEIKNESSNTKTDFSFGIEESYVTSLEDFENDNAIEIIFEDEDEIQNLEYEQSLVYQLDESGMVDEEV